MQLGPVLKQLRQRRGLTQMEVVKKAKVSQTYISQLESGAKEPSLTMLRKLGKIYKVPPQLIQTMAMDESDVPKANLKLFGQLKPVIDDIINQLIDNKLPK
jgi:transcriptional regulator with XRE-family HTH domain